MTTIYWDANAGSQLREVAKLAALDFLEKHRVTNPSSVHALGRTGRSILRQSRESVLKYLFQGNASKNAHLVFTSGGTESCNSMMLGLLDLDQINTKRNIVISALEHEAVTAAANFLKTKNFEIRIAKPKQGDYGARTGILDVESITNLVDADTELVSLMYASNETGAIQPLALVAEKLRSSGYDGIIVSDITQALTKSEINLETLFKSGVDAVAFSAHKIGALSGVGGLVFNTNSTCRQFQPLVMGGSQEDKLRAGTEFMLGIYTLGKVLETLINDTDELHRRTALLDYARTLIEKNIKEQELDINFLTPSEAGTYLCNTLLFRVTGVPAEDLLAALDLEGIYTSTGSACSSGKQDSTKAALAIGCSTKEARECLRISFDWDVTKSDIDVGVKKLSNCISRIHSSLKELN